MLVRRSLRLRFLGEEGEGGAGSEQLDTSSQAEPVVSDQQAAQQTGGNPAHDELRSQLDPISFSKIEPILKKMDTAAQQRITSVNQQFEPFKPFIEGRQPEYIQNALSYAEQLDKDPQKVYELLGEYLKQTGRLPNAQEVQAASDAGELDPEGTDAKQQPVADPRVDQIIGLLQQQANQQVAAAAESALDTEIKQLRAAHPEFNDEDQQEIVRRAAFVAQQYRAQGINKVPTLEEAAAEYTALRTRILSTPRPGDSAPTLLPTSGGTPSGQQQKSLGEMSRAETQDIIASLIEQNRQG